MRMMERLRAKEGWEWLLWRRRKLRREGNWGCKEGCVERRGSVGERAARKGYSEEEAWNGIGRG